MGFVVIILVVIYLRRSLKTAVAMPIWDQRLKLLMYVAIAGIVLQAITNLSVFFDFVGYILIAALLYAIYKLDEFKPARFLYTAIVPYMIVSFADEALRLINKEFYNSWRSVISSAQIFAFIWGLGVWFVTRKQQKELLKAHAHAMEEEKKNQFMNEMKAELEIQVAERTAELTKQKEALEVTVNELKATQAQLIQSEKMASLGELTAGIAHEIQNPLNFVNNFSEVNNELIEELKTERMKTETERDIHLENEILNDITQNNGKIAFHGKRADAIVKGMLQHSRKSTGQKEPTDINALCDEYLRLSYHGLRAKDKSFNAELKTDFDESIRTINVVPQDIGRVLLNLFNNAFYSVSHRRETAPESYRPSVSVTTKRTIAFSNMDAKDEVIITVKDNGIGISQAVLDKIFQPFFTTKPTGQGTGLGLSISYDIIKSHGGEIKVKTVPVDATAKQEGGTEFIIHLPM